MPNEVQRPEISQEEMQKKVGSDMPERKPLPLLPEREWINAHIADAKYQVSMFNNQVQYLTDQEDNFILDEEGNKIMRKEFEIVFEFDEYTIPGKSDKRKAWLRMGASLGEKAHLPVFLYNVLGPDADIETPQKIIDALIGKAVKLQVCNKISKDKTKTYQNVVWDAVKSVGKSDPVKPGPITQKDLKQEKTAWEEEDEKAAEGKAWDE